MILCCERRDNKRVIVIVIQILIDCELELIISATVSMKQQITFSCFFNKECVSSLNFRVVAGCAVRHLLKSEGADCVAQNEPQAFKLKTMCGLIISSPYHMRSVIFSVLMGFCIHAAE